MPLSTLTKNIFVASAKQYVLLNAAGAAAGAGEQP